MFVAEAESIEVDDFIWLVYNRKTPYKSQPQQYNPKHTMVLNQGDVYGVLRTRKKVYQLVKADAQHVLYRNIAPSVHDKLFKDSVPYRGRVDQQTVEEGFQRAKRVSTVQNESKKHVRTSPFFVPDGRIDEAEELDYSNYQWRKLLRTTKLESKKQGVVKKILKKDELIGLRFVSASVGGYVIHDSDHRVMISTDQYVELSEASKVLPLTQQLEGSVPIFNPRKVEKKRVDVKTLSGIKRRDPDRKQERPEVIEEEILPKYDLSNVRPIDFFKSKRSTKNTIDRTTRVMDKILDAPDLPEWEGDDAEELFDDAEENEEGEEEFEEDTESEEVEEDAEEEDSDEDVADDEELEETEASPLADVLAAGRIFVFKDRQFAIIQSGIMERNENLVEYVAHEMESDEEELYRFRLPNSYTMKQFLDKGYEILDNHLDDAELDKLQLLLEDAKFKPLPIAK